MKPGMRIGQTAEISAVVKPEMFAQFEGKVIHPAYSTVSMVYHMEWAARQIILPYLEDHEEGIGGAVTVRHVAPAGENSRIRAVATLTEIKNHMIITKVEVFNEKKRIGTGEVTQAILNKTDIHKKLAESSEMSNQQ